VAVAAAAGGGGVVPLHRGPQPGRRQLGREVVLGERAAGAEHEDVADLADLLGHLVAGLASEALVPIRALQMCLVRAYADGRQIGAPRGIARRRQGLALPVAGARAPQRARLLGGAIIGWHLTFA